MKNDSLGDRMKSYENITRNYLTRRIPVIIRLDGKAFHTFTKGLKKPFDRIFMEAMQQTMKRLCEEIQGCVFGYTQSDEITLVLTDYATITTDAWFGYNIQKMASVSASIATIEFNKALADIITEKIKDFSDEDYYNQEVPGNFTDLDEWNYLLNYQDKVFKATFDARVFSIPKDEVCNCLIWRQQDATRNSIEAVGQANFSHKQLMNKTCNMIQDMLWKEKGINWNDYPEDCKRGAACYKVEETHTEEVQAWIYCKDDKNSSNGCFKECPPSTVCEVIRRRWQIDRAIPIFTQDRDFIEKWL